MIVELIEISHQTLRFELVEAPYKHLTNLERPKNVKGYKGKRAKLHALLKKTQMYVSKM